MNFVDVQPKSFLDYAWTSPSPAAVTTIKSSKTSRKQNRCCDQCRKGKRACDAAILEDTLLDATKTGGSPTVFHYSDVFGPLTACGNCEKTKKNCTFEWLRSQRVLQAAQPPQSSAPPAKRRRTQSTSSGAAQVKKEKTQSVYDVGPDSQLDAKNEQNYMSQQHSPVEFGITFADFPGMISAFDSGPTTVSQSVRSVPIDDFSSILEDGLGCSTEMFEDDQVLINDDSGQGSSIGTLSESVDDSGRSESPSTPYVHDIDTIMGPSKINGVVLRTGRKRRRRLSGPISNGALPYPALSFANDLFSSTNNAILTESLLRIYHDSFSNALSCWVTERTCPFGARTDAPMASNAKASPGWDRIYHQVFRLDRLAASIRGRQLTFTEDKASSKALNMSICAFASQWAQSSQRSRAKYPFHSDGTNDGNNVFDAADNASASDGVEFDRALQISSWHEARIALQNAGEIESFRVVLAEIVFALTQKPVECDEGKPDYVNDMELQDNSVSGLTKTEVCDASLDDQDQDVNECEDLLSKLDLAMDSDGPPVHLEKGLRLIHSLRSRMALYGGRSRKPGQLRRGKQYRASAGGLESADRATVDLLFWLGVMFDTLSAAMHRRPLVVSDEDSDMVLKESRQVAVPINDGAELVSMGDGNVLWDDYLFARQQERIQEAPTRWPCSFDQAAATLCDAAPVKVLLFRRVTRIQTLLARFSQGKAIENAVRAAVEVTEHWNRSYAPFIQDCIRDHDRLPPRVQSWYICLTGHWHLATLLLADLIEIIDESGLGIDAAKIQRDSTEFVAHFRERNCQSLSDLARCACPRDDASFSKSHEFHFAVSQGALLTEPWTAVLIRAFAKAGVILLEAQTLLPSNTCGDQEEAFRRADDCIQALWFLGRKSDMALSAAKILGEALKQRRKSALERVNAMSAFLEDELWHGFEDLNGTFGIDCES
ncbi:hypothetical protein BKA66DRAFT_575125 [Pyrenochaeta sp. MPI-SDFR-AT-0127]|nr:hypothetical protein BKA66DRAFT_575125 [Pyrenochaeta sp. MPI-SDFR-AT-0127]